MIECGELFKLGSSISYSFGYVEKPESCAVADGELTSSLARFLPFCDNFSYTALPKYMEGQTFSRKYTSQYP